MSAPIGRGGPRTRSPLRRTGAAWLLRLILMGLLAPSLVQAQALPRWTLSEDLRIGSIDRANYVFADLGWVIVSESGDLFVNEIRQGEVLAYDEWGRFLRRFGRRGEGPGEFRSTSGGIGWVGENLWVLDRFLNRITVFTQEGTLVETMPVEPPGTAPLGSRRVEGLLDDGAILAVPHLSPPTLGQSFLQESQILKIAPGLQRIEPLVTVTSAPSPPRLAVPTASGVQSADVRPVWNQDRIALSADGSRFAVAAPSSSDGVAIDQARIRVYDRDGIRLWERVLSLPPLPVSPQERDDIRGDLAQALIRLGIGASDAVRMAVAGYDVPEYRFPVRSILFGLDNTLWISREDRPGEFTILDEAGRPLAELTMPSSRYRTLALSTRAVWVSQTDDLGVPYLVRYAVQR